MLLLLSLACSPLPECAEGQYVTAKNTCADLPTTPPVESPDEAPPCVYATPGDRLDLTRGCADGVCVDLTYAELVEAVGEPATCRDGYNDRTVRCYWSDDTVHVYFEDADDDLLPDDEDEVAGVVFVGEDWDGADADGLGVVGMSMACYPEVHGEPDRLEYLDETGAGLPIQYGYDTPHFIVDDRNPFEVPDGVVDGLALYGLE